MSQELAQVPNCFVERGNGIIETAIYLLLGTVLLSLLARVVIHLPWTPIPITGQTLGVIYIALAWGRKRATASIITYISLGALGLPIFAAGKAGLSIGPSSGYLFGMVVATIWIGTISDSRWINAWYRSFLVAISGQLIILTFGAIGLSFYVPANELMATGVFPFIFGDIMKCLVASTMASTQKIT